LESKYLSLERERERERERKKEEKEILFFKKLCGVNKIENSKVLY